MEVKTLARLILGGAWDSEELGENDIEPDMPKIEALQLERVKGFDDVYVDLIDRDHFDRVTAERDSLQQRLNAVEEENDRLRSAAQKVIDMNRQHAEDQYGDAEKAEAWSCVTELRAALENRS